MSVVIFEVSVRGCVCEMCSGSGYALRVCQQKGILVMGICREYSSLVINYFRCITKGERVCEVVSTSRQPVCNLSLVSRAVVTSIHETAA